MLYVFTGFPGKALPPGFAHLNAGGLKRVFEDVEMLGELVSDPAVCYKKEGVFIVQGSYGERQGPIEYRMSAALEREGIGWDWFPENWGFGNGVTIHKTTANREMMLVDHNSGQSVDDLLTSGHPLELGKLRVQRIPKRTEGWEKYEERWRPGTCPQESHIVHLTWLVTKRRLPEFAYLRLEQLIEGTGMALRDAGQYKARHFSISRKWDGNTVPPSKEMLKLLGD